MLSQFLNSQVNSASFRKIEIWLRFSLGKENVTKCALYVNNLLTAFRTVQIHYKICTVFLPRF